jgi:hypothetical protein
MVGGHVEQEQEELGLVEEHGQRVHLHKTAKGRHALGGGESLDSMPSVPLATPTHPPGRLAGRSSPSRWAAAAAAAPVGADTEARSARPRLRRALGRGPGTTCGFGTKRMYCTSLHRGGGETGVAMTCQTNRS